MTNSEMGRVMAKLVSVTQFLGEEGADLVRDRANRGRNAEAPGINARSQAASRCCSPISASTQITRKTATNSD